MSAQIQRTINFFLLDCSKDKRPITMPILKTGIANLPDGGEVPANVHSRSLRHVHTRHNCEVFEFRNLRMEDLPAKGRKGDDTRADVALASDEGLSFSIQLALAESKKKAGVYLGAAERATGAPALGQLEEFLTQTLKGTRIRLSVAVDDDFARDAIEAAQRLQKYEVTFVGLADGASLSGLVEPDMVGSTMETVNVTRGDSFADVDRLIDGLSTRGDVKLIRVFADNQWYRIENQKFQDRVMVMPDAKHPRLADVVDMRRLVAEALSRNLARLEAKV